MIINERQEKERKGREVRRRYRQRNDKRNVGREGRGEERDGRGREEGGQKGRKEVEGESGARGREGKGSKRRLSLRLNLGLAWISILQTSPPLVTHFLQRRPLLLIFSNSSTPW